MRPSHTIGAGQSKNDNLHAEESENQVAAYGHLGTPKMLLKAQMVPGELLASLQFTLEGERSCSPTLVGAGGGGSSSGKNS